ncbi:N-formylglutamate deformylase [Gluconobacter kanchanaburiensis]|uniref:N-formylglutamate deformylase n=1 Tax=Gluconobacter kanchanaburiensis NBRC 103587 TaxID=1307948 RepID=A0A511B743_9PROT|nr:N-formylglutamate deformylase [Gluconobacter kanchanaburiensis]MBF0862266.1 N-formylglutamate deformylase [Gluconobacter kanchanaburiensis]GBR68966.1 N-formylglutamate amidohydrolase [Gluconobacter kanchanaburiensis NBRC 103587]GEK96256.1 N-formylglutamate deformylase [Gluconobacter kanchanaburiensis NBRC 103587]
MTDVFSLVRGTMPVLVTLPHSGCHLAPGMERRMTARGRQLPDTDWYMEHLYAGALSSGIGVLKASHSRYVVDLNRGADDAALYPGRPSTGLVPSLTFDGLPIYRAGQEPDDCEIAERREAYWRPYHAAVTEELERLRQKWGWAVLWDGHSIKSDIPRLFEGTLPDLNIGTNSGQSCNVDLEARLGLRMAESPFYSHVVNGRFKGGYTTRHYGQPARGIHAVQLEIAQSTYLKSEDGPWPIDLEKAVRLSRMINALLETALCWRPE